MSAVLIKANAAKKAVVAATGTSRPDGGAAAQVSKLTRLVVWLSISVVALLVALIIAIVFLTRTHREVIAATPDGRLIPIVPLDKPYVSDARVLGYVDECARMLFSHDFLHWRKSLQESKTCFTEKGGDAVEEALGPWVQDIVAREMTMSVSLSNTPVIAKRGQFDGMFAWRVQAPITLFRRGTKTQDQPRYFILHVVVRRVGLDQNPRGIAIDSLQLVPDQSRA
ncbi:DotI/IcmL family type IV secretion protein [Variovorax sp. RA8]|uniref:DotI/IcmL family type IV secretion protein n=1 Tax=Variovorax sp. (strain JCM 16519 / RA8) TaxID=662548 RepID=UPI0013189B93|nr:DotI/IcmL family type IV secretion protein [Variovorax sp. RA8]VTU44974.1 Macrophage killing protein with similarity to conjugation protein [Variovorax sp. RA8]